MSLKGATAIIGFGSSEIVRRSDRSITAFSLDAALAALKDAGIERDEIDGFVGAPWAPNAGAVNADGADEISMVAFARAMGLNNLRYTADLYQGYSTDMVATAAQALASGRCRYVLGLRAMYNVQGVSYGTGNAEPAFGNEQFTKPFGYKIGGARFALRINRYMQRFGMKREDLYEVVALSRRHAAANPLAVWRGKDVSLEQYMDAAMVAYPHCMFDCDMPVCGASAFVMARVEDMPKAASPAYVTGLAGCHQPLEVFDMSGVGRDDVGLCQLYDGFSSMLYEWLEGFGFCGEGEAWKFVRDGHANAEGRLPVNTFGGSIGEGRLHGIGHLREAYLQVAGKAGARQVENSDHCLVQVGPYDTGSFVMLSREAR